MIRSRLVVIDSHARLTIPGADPLFEGGLCPRCHMPRGPRTDIALALESIPKNVDGGAAQIRRPLGAGPRIRFFSEAFIERLTPAERRRLVLREVEHPAKTQRSFFELLGGTARYPFVAVKGIGSASLTLCDACGYERPPVYSTDPDVPSRYVAATDVPRRPPSVFVLGDAVEPMLGMAPARWKELEGGKGTRGLASFTIGVLDVALVDPDPARTPMDAY